MTNVVPAAAYSLLNYKEYCYILERCCNRVLPFVIPHSKIRHSLHPIILMRQRYHLRFGGYMQLGVNIGNMLADGEYAEG